MADWFCIQVKAGARCQPIDRDKDARPLGSLYSYENRAFGEQVPHHISAPSPETGARREELPLSDFIRTQRWGIGRRFDDGQRRRVSDVSVRAAR